jgi:branched-chain amino acid transport system permease protein
MLKRVGGIAVLIGLLFAPWGLPPFYLLLLNEILIWALFALSFNLVYGYVGLLSLGQSVYFGFGAYGVALSLLYLSDSLILALFMGIGASLLAAAIIGFFAIRVKGHGFIILTAVTALVMYSALTNPNLSPITGGDQGRTFLLPTLGPLDLSDPATRYFSIAVIVVIAFFGIRWLLSTPLGLSWRLVRDNEQRAAELGYPVRKLQWLAFTVSGALAGLAGVLFALFNRFVDASLVNWLLSADVIVWTLVGGAGTLWGPVLGVFGFKILEEFLGQLWAGGLPLLLGIALLFVVRFFPNGLGRWRFVKKAAVEKGET